MLVLMLTSMLMSHASVDFFALSFVLPCAYAYSLVKTRLNALLFPAPSQLSAFSRSISLIVHRWKYINHAIQKHTINETLILIWHCKRQRKIRCLKRDLNSHLVFHISEDGSEIELKHCASSKTSVKSSRKYFVHLNWIRLATNPSWFDSSIRRAAV